MKPTRDNESQPVKAPLRSLHLRILNDVRENILSGAWKPGHRLQTETDMARAYGCSRMTVNKALVQLTQAGLLQRTRKSGTFVNAPQSQSVAIQINDIRQEVESSGRTYTYRLIEDRTRDTTPDDAPFLDMEGIDRVREVTCLHLAGGTPFCFEERLINLAVVPGVAEFSFDESGPGGWLLKQVPWLDAEHQIFACAATVETADILAIEEGGPCLVVERRTRNAKGRVTSARLTYAASQYRLIATFAPTE